MFPSSQIHIGDARSLLYHFLLNVRDAKSLAVCLPALFLLGHFLAVRDNLEVRKYLDILAIFSLFAGALDFRGHALVIKSDLRTIMGVPRSAIEIFISARCLPRKITRY